MHSCRYSGAAAQQGEMMKSIFVAIFIGLISMPLLARELPLVLQLKYSPLGTINADEDKFNHDDYSYEKYDMDFERSIGVKVIFSFVPVYIAAQQNITNLDESIPDTKVDTFSLGFGGINYDEFANDAGIYLMGGVGVGAGKFQFKQPELNDWEALIEGNAEIGLRIQEHFLLGVGVDYQHFGEPGETKAHLWNLYIGTSLVF
jgi:hypothetical protein